MLLVEQRHVSCTFDEQFICGYDTSWVAVDSLTWKRTTAEEDNTFYYATKFSNLGECDLLLISKLYEFYPGGLTDSFNFISKVR